MKNRLRDYRQQRCLSQQALADALGVSRQTIMSIEKGRYVPSRPLTFQLAQKFNCRSENLFIYND
ncbi:MAG TPA: helix-turn-helix transcriptional regulator [Yaniella sp.]